MSPITIFILAFIASAIPIIIWLWFLEHEDKHPEPLKLTILAFIGGMIAVVAVIPFEKWVVGFFGYNPASKDTLIIILTSITIVLWSFLEEIFKLLAAFFLVLIRAENDEPIDSMMYLIATALGFATLENTLYIFRPLLLGNLFNAVAISNFRFFGATILHTIASSVIGASLALAYYKAPRFKKWYVLMGIIVATALHASFNLSIIYLDETRSSVAFYGVWIVFVGVLLIFEKVKQLTKPNNI
jgi:RsiW-degrading membrane proteinase PrsW (M82 family)